ncbi:hydroquinone glucosyltransferase-like [Andrographis paniculata]|uniref:hydroquinone glucosyltransferase-like n=1 Tax=Andrographis paniculata TaxID=175694 RepID=UPI0021E74FC5|nr:hydroquinone glucosyltransferase-like [Andrographis paniculata]
MALHIAILPTPGIGHLIPLAEFARKLYRRHQISSTFIIPTDQDAPFSPRQQTLLATLPPPINHLLLPAVNLHDLPPDVRAETRIALTVARSLPSIRAAFKSLLSSSSPIAAVVVDLFGTDAFEIAREFQLPPYIFFPSTATCLSLFLHLLELHRTTPSEYRDSPEPFRLPGCTPISGEDLVDPLQDRSNSAYQWILHYCRRYPLAEGIIVNTCTQLEPGPIKALQLQIPNLENPNPKIYPIGPLTHSAAISNQMTGPSSSSIILQWLNQQPIGSVLYVSFGSGGSLRHEQLIELALGLELSEQRFLMVVRCPSDKSASAGYFSTDDSSDPLSYLPDGFLDRTAGRGLAVPFWAPQVEILEHRCTGGFLTHCGWNSTLESVVSGVPLLLWPLFAEQRMNAVMLHEELKVGVRVLSESGGGGAVVGREAVARAVRDLMGGDIGDRNRSRIRDLKIGAAAAIGEGGASAQAFDQLAERWKEEGARRK